MAAVWLIAGPTASGKSALALNLAEAIGGEIVNADSMQLYRDLAVLTARPTVEDTNRVFHHLYGVADAADGWSVGRWLRAVETVLADLSTREKPAVIVGGTGLYFRALTQGLADIPPVSDETRARAEAIYAADGEDGVRVRLLELDPPAASRIARNDRQRLVRALAVAMATGRGISEWQAQTKPLLDRFEALVLEPPRAALYARCDLRFERMMEAGALEEARALLARGLDPELPLMKAVGLRELGRYLAGELSLADAVALGQQETRRYAKRQTTWFSNQTQDWPRVEAFGEAVDPADFLSGRAELSPPPVA